MTERRFKWDFNVYVICGLIFSAVGLIFLIVSAGCVIKFDDLRGQIDGNPVLFVGIFAGLGLLETVVGISILVWYFKKTGYQKKLYEAGRYITLPVSEIRMDTRVRINGRHPYVAEAQYMDPVTKEVYVFRSRSLMYNPANMLIDGTVRVYVDSENYKRYYMDIDSAMFS